MILMHVKIWDHPYRENKNEHDMINVEVSHWVCGDSLYCSVHFLYVWKFSKYRSKRTGKQGEIK